MTRALPSGRKAIPHGTARPAATVPITSGLALRGALEPEVVVWLGEVLLEEVPLGEVPLGDGEEEAPSSFAEGVDPPQPVRSTASAAATTSDRWAGAVVRGRNMPRAY